MKPANPRGLIFTGELVPGVMDGTIVRAQYEALARRLIKRSERGVNGCMYWMGAVNWAGDWHGVPYRVRSSMFMPLRYARTWVEILSVRPVRCQEITREEILASGVTFPGRDQMLSIAPIVEASDLAHLRNAYAALWDRLNAKRGFPWSGNWWCWRMTFRLTTKGAAK